MSDSLSTIQVGEWLSNQIWEIPEMVLSFAGNILFSMAGVFSNKPWSW
jgi:hypothetical protein